MKNHQTNQLNHAFVLISKQREGQKIFFEIEVDNAKTMQPAITVDETFDSLEEVNDYLNHQVKPHYNIDKQIIVDFTEMTSN